MPDTAPTVNGNGTVDAIEEKKDAAKQQAAEATKEPPCADTKTVPRPAALPIFVVRDAKGAIAFYEKALLAKTKFNYPAENGMIMHAYLESPLGKGFGFALEDSGAIPEMDAVNNVEALEEGATKARGSYLYVNVEGKGSCNDAVERMREAGATVTMAPKDMFYGSRVGKCLDPYGIAWSFSEDVDAAAAAKASEKGNVDSQTA